MKNYEVEPKEEEKKMNNSQKQNQIKKLKDLWGGQARKEPVKIENQITIPHK